MEKKMKKKYTKPELLIFKITSNYCLLIGSVQIAEQEDEANEDETGSRENNIFDNNHSIWDNAW